MAEPRGQKRKCSEELSQNSHPRKRSKSACERNFSPAFWDRLSVVPLTARALREFDRRNKNLHQKHPAHQIRDSNLLRFVRHGGPDLSDLRGFAEPEIIAQDMSSSQSSTGRSRQTQSTKATTVTSKTRKSSAYGKEFQQYLTDYNIHINSRKSKPENVKEIQSELTQDRASLSPSKFSDGAFERFQKINDDSVFETDIMTKVIPTICGISSIPNQQNVLFTELAPIADEHVVKPKPDFFDGSQPHDLNRDIRNDEDLRPMVIPTKHASVPIAPNFYMEVKGPDGSAAVAQRQACFDGAHGVRAMHALQNYGKAVRNSMAMPTHIVRLTMPALAHSYSMRITPQRPQHLTVGQSII